MKPRKCHKNKSNPRPLSYRNNCVFRSQQTGGTSRQRVARRNRRYNILQYQNVIAARLSPIEAIAVNNPPSGSETSSAGKLRSERLERNGFINGNMIRSNLSDEEEEEEEQDPHQHQQMYSNTDDVIFLPEQDPIESENEELPNYSIQGNVSDRSCSLNNSADEESNTPFPIQSDVSEASFSPTRNEFEVSLKNNEVASSGSSIRQKPDKFQVFSHSQYGCVVVALPHETTLSLRGKVLVTVLSGCVEIFGYTMTSEKEETVPVYSSDISGCMQVRTKSAYWKDSEHCRRIASLLKKYIRTDEFNVDEVLSVCHENTVLLLLRKHDLAYASDFACNYIPDALPVPDPASNSLGCMGFSISMSDMCTVTVNEDLVDAAEVVDTAVQASDRDESGAPIVMVMGNRGMGKSTSIRYISNVLLSNIDKFYYLDVDPGQSEFTPPGCVSLTEVTKPLLGQPFTHPKTPVKIAFYGNISIEDDDRFCPCIAEVVNVYKKYFSAYPLIINTFGWLKGLGLECLNFLKDILPPSIQIELVDDGSVAVGLPPERYLGDIDALLEAAKDRNEAFRMQIKGFRANKEVWTKQLSALSRRSLSILSYFGRCQPYFSSPKTMNSLEPFYVRVEDVALHTTHDIFSHFTLQAFVKSFVALCIVDESQILVCNNNEKEHKHLKPDANYRKCVGFGFIRGMDLERNIFYVLTPEPFSVIKDVNAFVKGNIKMPAEIFQRQDIYNVQMPYVKQLHGKKMGMSKNLKRQF